MHVCMYVYKSACIFVYMSLYIYIYIYLRWTPISEKVQVTAGPRNEKQGSHGALVRPYWLFFTIHLLECTLS